MDPVKDSGARQASLAPCISLTPASPTPTQATAGVAVANDVPTASVSASAAPAAPPSAGSVVTITATASDVGSNLTFLAVALTGPDGASTSWGPAGPDSAFSPAACSGTACAPAALTPQVTCPGTYLVTATATDADGATCAAAPASVTVTGPPSLSADPAFNDDAVKNSPDTASVTVAGETPSLDAATFTVTPMLMPLTSAVVTAAVTASDPGKDLTAIVIDWDDGTAPSSYPCASLSANCPLPASATHPYTAAGVYLPTATVTDADGVTAGPLPLPAGFVVVYDPQGGFVTGGGWIVSPPGALASNPAATGRANFGFNSKYQRGANVPTGSTEFVFQAGRFKFKSTSYDWMVVSGSRVQYKGTGIVNGNASPAYKFSLMAVDGGNSAALDSFRLPVFSVGADGAEAKVYDNYVGSADFTN
ncbi:hypothetical protein HYH03_016279 [Edaphochlamys debaryana]|uniref:Uncharacterized protein n=1 Tax=Edaphochlamys debaryana TaxID=47281 RepID=A0A835XML5_9CHLO|nr:hypothetical protein HYH03_016279 [Edaphochlamys debaryana]|eukprot:KAG2484986.1 hypothetical protein HYH03_016279 [Edaphochlamys debaryana]